MNILILSIFRTKIKLVLSIFTFTIVFGLMMVVINNYITNSKEIEKLKKSEIHTTITISSVSEKYVEKIENISHINNIEKKSITSSNEYTLIISIDDETNVDDVESKILSFGLKPSKSTIISPKLEMYIEIDNFNKLFAFVIITGLLLLLLFQIKLQFIWENNNILFLKILGYNRLLILIIIIGRVYVPILLANIISIILFLTFYIANNYTYSPVVILLPFIFFVCAIIFLIPLLFSKIKKITFLDKNI